MSQLPSKSLYLDPNYLVPLEREEWRRACTCCGSVQSMFGMGIPGERKPVCALCFLYRSRWGKNHREEIDILVDGIEQDVGEKFFRELDGKTLVSDVVANNVLGALMLAGARLADLLEHMKQRVAQDQDQATNDVERGSV